MFKNKKAGFIGAFIFGALGFFIGLFSGGLFGLFTQGFTIEAAGYSLIGGIIGLIVGWLIGFLIATPTLFLWGIALLYFVAPDTFPGFIDDFVILAIRGLIQWWLKV